MKIFPKNSIRRQLLFYIGAFVVLPLCLGLFSLNAYLQKSSRENNLQYYSSVLSQIKDNADQMIEVTNYSTSMTMVDKDILGNLRLLSVDTQTYQMYRAKTDISNYLGQMESSVLNAINGKMAILTSTDYLIGSNSLSKTKADYKNTNWYLRILENGRKTTFCPEISRFFEEMNPYMQKNEQYLYIGRSIVDYSGKNLGIMLIQLSGKKIWGKLAETIKSEAGASLYIFDREYQLQMEYNGVDKTTIEELKSSLEKWKLSHSVQRAEKNGLLHMAVLLECGDNILVYTMPRKTLLQETTGILRSILILIVILVFCIILILIYVSRKLSEPLIYVADSLEHEKDSIFRIQEPEKSFLEIQKFISSYNKAGRRIEELIERVKAESQLKERAHYEMLMSQISPHFIFNTVNSIRIMAKEEKAGYTESALESLGEILHGVYGHMDGMTTMGQEITLLQAYVNIMQMRFGNSFQYYNVIPTELFCYEIPAFTMQPIVENAILHGVKDIEAGQIIVSAVEYEEDFVISIFNNGSSADKEMINRLLRTPDCNKRNFTGIGLYNVNLRLKMLYGETYGLIFNEQVQNGFEIWIRMPKRCGEIRR